MVEKASDKTESGVVTVACKLPNGLVLQLFDMVDRDEVTLGGGMRTVKTALRKGDPVQLKGCAAPFGSPIVTVGGYALTQNVDAQFFNEWLRQNDDSDIVKNRLVFAHSKADFVNDKAEESADVMSGLQPINPEGDPRSPKSRSGVGKIETAKAA